MKWWMERAEIVKQWCFACHCHIPRTDVSCVKWDSKCWQMLMFPWSGLNRFRIKATLDFISPHHPAIMFTVSSHSLAFHTSKDITWLWDINLCAVELWPVFLLHNMKHKWTHSSHGNNYISQSPKVAGDLYPIKAFALKKKNIHHLLYPPWSSPGLMEQICAFYPWLRGMICLYPLFESSRFLVTPGLMHWTLEDIRKNNYQHLLGQPSSFLQIFLVLRG